MKKRPALSAHTVPCLCFALVAAFCASCRSTQPNRFSALSSARQHDLAFRMAEEYTTPCFESDAERLGVDIQSEDFQIYIREMEEGGRKIQQRIAKITGEPVFEIHRLEHQVLLELFPDHSFYHVQFISRDPRIFSPHLHRQWAVMAICDDMTPLFLTSSEDILNFISRSTEDFGDDRAAHAIFAHKAMETFALLRGGSSIPRTPPSFGARQGVERTVGPRNIAAAIDARRHLFPLYGR